MFDIVLSEDSMIKSENSSGSQTKYYSDGYWYKIDNFGGESMAEELSSVVLKYSSLSSNEYVVYERGVINGVLGCRSKNFLQEEEQFFFIYQAS